MQVFPSLHFEVMFNWLCEQLPPSVPLGETDMRFYNLLDNLEAKHFEDEETTLISNLGFAFYTVVHTAKNILTKLIPADVRMDKVKKNFDDRLRDVVKSFPDRLTQRDLELIDEYFHSNS